MPFHNDSGACSEILYGMAFLEPIEEKPKERKKKEKKQKKLSEKMPKKEKKKKSNEHITKELCEEIKLLRQEVDELRLQQSVSSLELVKEGSNRTMQTEEYSWSNSSDESTSNHGGSSRTLPSSNNRKTDQKAKCEIVFDRHSGHCELESSGNRSAADQALNSPSSSAAAAKVKELFALCRKGKWFNVRKRLDRLESSCSRRELQAILLSAPGPDNMTPLHIMCTLGAPRYLVYWMVSLAPQACQQMDYASRLPIHCAISHGADPEVVQVLTTAYPESVHVADKTGLRP